MYLQWASEFGAIEDFYEPEEGIRSEEDAKNWLLALMAQIENQYTPADTDYIDRAIQATEGKSLSEPRPDTFKNSPRCPVCDALFFQFRGFNTHEQAENHFEFMDDEEHDDWEISIEKK